MNSVTRMRNAVLTETQLLIVWTANQNSEGNCDESTHCIIVNYEQDNMFYIKDRKATGKRLVRVD